MEMDWIAPVSALAGVFLGGFISYYAAAKTARMTVYYESNAKWIDDFRAAAADALTVMMRVAIAERDTVEEDMAQRLLLARAKLILLLDHQNLLHSAFLNEIKLITQKTGNKHPGTIIAETSILGAKIVREREQRMAKEMRQPWDELERQIRM